MDYETIRTNIENGVYQTKIVYPERLRKPVMQPHCTSADARRYADELKVYEDTVGSYRELINDYHKDVDRLERTVFKAHCEIAYDLVDHPKADKIWSIAWDHGHASGLGEVLYWYDELAGLVK